LTIRKVVLFFHKTFGTLRMAQNNLLRPPIGVKLVDFCW